MEQLLMTGIKSGAGGSSDDMRNRSNTYTSSTNFLSTSMPVGGKVSPVYHGSNNDDEDTANGDDEDNDVGMRSIFAKLLSLKVIFNNHFIPLVNFIVT